MSDLICETKENVFIMSLNRCDKHNAFDDKLIFSMQKELDDAIDNPKIRVILLRANGRHFSAGADANWMQRMSRFSEDENHQDAMVLAKLLRTLHQCPKPTVAAVQGAAYGGGAGLVAACDMAIAAHSARFCFAEVKLGLIPAVISPYVVKALGERVSKWLFMTAEIFDATQAKHYNLVQHCVDDEALFDFAVEYSQKITRLAPKAVVDCKTLVELVNGRQIDAALMHETAQLIAQKRVSTEGQRGLLAFLAKETPQWN